MKEITTDFFRKGFEDYQIIDLLHKSNKTLVYMAQSVLNQTKVAIKIPTNPLDEKYVDSIIHEASFLQSMSFDGVPKFIELRKAALIMEHVEGITMYEYLSKKEKISYLTFLEIGISIALTLEKIHQIGIVHTDLNPTNIILDKDKKLTYVIDFGLAARYQIHLPANLPPAQIQGVLQYISPEQTGRMNRGIDLRSDFYSLGVLFYQLLAGVLPFNSKDPLELLHAHLAVNPEPLQTYRSDIPKDLQELVLRLLAKNPEDRYQTGNGLVFDLNAIYQRLNRNDSQSIELGKNEKILKFEISPKLYGRESDKEILLNSFDASAAGQKRMLLVRAPSGYGKSSLIAEVHRPITANKGLFLNGKFDASRRNVSYSAWKQVLEKFLEWILSLPDFDELRNKIQLAVSSNGAILLDILPEFEKVIGAQPPLAEQDSSNLENRFFNTLKNFFVSICSNERPIVIFIDDWQWADRASIILLKELLEERDLSYVLFICAFRDNEIGNSHPFQIILEQTDPRFANFIDQIVLKPLNQDQITELLKDTFKHTDSLDLTKLASILFDKTFGNAFFIHQIIKNLHKEKIIYPESGTWKINFEKLDQLNATSNVVEFMLDKLTLLPELTKKALLLAACIGNQFQSSLVRATYDWDVQKFYKAIDPALEQGLIQALDSDRLEFKFVHDSIQKACYKIRKDEERIAVEYELAKCREKTLKIKHSKNLLLLTTQSFNNAKQLIVDGNEKIKVAQLNLLSSQSAQDYADYTSGLEFSLEGLNLLHKDSWKDNYELTRDLHSQALESAYHLGGHAQTAFWLQELLTNAQSDLDKAVALEIKMDYHKANQDYVSAFEVGMEILNLLGIKLKRPNVFNIIVSILSAKAKLDRIGFDKLLNYRHTQSQVAAVQERALLNLGIVVYFSRPKYLPILAPAQIELVLKNGFTHYTPYTFMSFALNMIVGLGNIDYGYKLGRLANDIKQQFPETKLEGRIGFLHRHFVRHWVETHKDVAKSSVELYYRCVELGDFEFAVYSAISATKMLYMSGQPLIKIKQLAASWQTEIKEKLKSKSKYDEYLAVHSFISWFTNDSSGFSMWDGEQFNEEKLIEIFNKSQNKTALAAIFWGRMTGWTILNQWEKAERDCISFEQYAGSTSATVDWMSYLFYKSLIFIEKMRNEAKIDKKMFSFVKKNRTRFKKWAKNSEVNFLPKYYFLEAEIARLKKSYYKAIEFYSICQDQSAKSGNLLELGFSHERNASLHIELNQVILARFHAEQALTAYSYWQSPKKIAEFEERFAMYLDKKDQAVNYFDTSSSSHSTRSQNVDTLTLIKSSTAISSEIELEGLIEKMLEVVIANAGAQRGLLITYENDTLSIQGEIDARGSVKKFVRYDSLDNLSSSIPFSLAYYSARSAKKMILKNPTQEGQYTQEPYFKQNVVKDLLILPLIKQKNVVGLLYLEHYDSPDVFSIQRVDLLSLLAGQMAVSLENSLLYEDLENKVKQRTEEVFKQKDIIEKQKDELLKVNRDLFSSINYAKEIQQAMLIPEIQIKDILKDHFILLMPRDIVSGDFYWIRKQGEKIFVAAVDCTGHGVPGALVSMIANSSLDDILQKKQIFLPNQILSQLRMSMQDIFKTNQLGLRVGMDIALVCIDYENEKILFSGAKNPVIYFQNGQQQVIKGSPFSIESQYNESQQDFLLHEIGLVQTPTRVYLFSDGYIDQFGGEQRRKFSTKRFKELLSQIASEDFMIQKNHLKQGLSQWMEQGFEKQIDDILVIGFEV